MPPDAVASLASSGKLVDRLPQAWRGPLLRLALAWVLLFGFMAGDWVDMADQWWNSSTYNHIVLLPPIVAWLVWVRRSEIAQLTPKAWSPGLVLLAGTLFVWLLGAFSGLNLARQLGAVMALQAATIALLGPRVAAGLFFPLCYAFFLVPFGDELVPILQTITAELTIAFTHWSGIPAEIEGVFINTPAGLFEVAEACSGVKFLIAMLALGVLVAHVCFKDWKRRAAFIGIALVLPIVANGVRAWGTIYIAQFKGVEFAAGFDHIIYGWVFFAFVMVVLLALAWRFFDRAVDDPMTDAAAIEASPFLARLDRWHLNGWAALAAVAGLTLSFGLWFDRASRLEAPVPSEFGLPSVPGWGLVAPEPDIVWEPRANGASVRILGRYRDHEGHTVDVFYAFYASQSAGSEAGGFGEGALVPDSEWHWLETGPAFADAKSEVLFARGAIHRLAVTSYRTGSLLTGSNTLLKLVNMQDRLLMRTRPTTMLILSATDVPGHPADDSIAAFRAAAGPQGEWMDGFAGLD